MRAASRSREEAGIATSSGHRRIELPSGPEAADAVRRGSLSRALAAPALLLLRRPVLGVLLVAFLARAVVSVGVAVFFDGSLFLDDSTYSVMAAQRADGDTGDWDDYTFFLYDATATFLIPLTVLYAVFGPAALLGGLLAGAFGAIAAAAVTRCALEMMPVRWAVTAGLIVALLPSQVLFSSITLKDSTVWAVLTAIAAVVAWAGRRHGALLVAAALAVSTLFFLLAHLRLHTLVAAAWAVAIAAWFGVERQRAVRGLGAAVLLMTVPWLVGIGPAGLTLVLDSSDGLDERRSNNAVGAVTAFVEPARPGPDTPTGAGVPPGDSAEPRPAGAATDPATPPARTRPLDDAAGDLGRDFRHLPRGLSVMLVEPYVWADGASTSVNVARAEALLWWPLLALAALGLLRSRRHMRAMAFPILAAGAITVLYALSEGNFGTAYRHRGEIVWAVALLATLGLQSLRDWTTRSDNRN